MDKTMDTYIDEVFAILKEHKKEQDHVKDLAEVFAILKEHKLILNLLGKLKNVHMTFGNSMRDRGESRANYGNQ